MPVSLLGTCGLTHHMWANATAQASAKIRGLFPELGDPGPLLCRSRDTGDPALLCAHEGRASAHGTAAVRAPTRGRKDAAPGTWGSGWATPLECARRVAPSPGVGVVPTSLRPGRSPVKASVPSRLRAQGRKGSGLAFVCSDTEQAAVHPEGSGDPGEGGQGAQPSQASSSSSPARASAGRLPSAQHQLPA